jgi:hypothetical protein
MCSSGFNILPPERPRGMIAAGTAQRPQKLSCLSATSGKAGGLRKVGRLKAAWPCGRSCRCSSQRRRRGIFVVVKRQPTKRRQARHLQKPYPEYAAPSELGNSPRDTATMMPRPRRSHQLPLLPCAAGTKYSRKCQTPRVLRQSRRVSYWTKTTVDAPIE